MARRLHFSVVMKILAINIDRQKGLVKIALIADTYQGPVMAELTNQKLDAIRRLGKSRLRQGILTLHLPVDFDWQSGHDDTPQDLVDRLYSIALHGPIDLDDADTALLTDLVIDRPEGYLDLTMPETWSDYANSRGWDYQQLKTFLQFKGVKVKAQLAASGMSAEDIDGDLIKSGRWE